MSYTPNIWNSGDVITKAKLDHMEQGILDASENVVIVHASAEYDQEHETYTNVTADKTPAEVIGLIDSGKTVLIALQETGSSSCRYLNLSSYTSEKATFINQEIHDTLDAIIDADIYTFELSC